MGGGWGVGGEERGKAAISFLKLPAGSEGLGEARKNNPQAQLLQAPPGSRKADMCTAAGGQVRQGGPSLILGEPPGPAELRRRSSHLSA